MSLLFETDTYSILDHSEYINNLYVDVIHYDKIVTYNLTPRIFSIIIEKANLNRKRTHNSRNFSEDTLKIQSLYRIFLKEIPNNVKIKIKTTYNLLNTSDVRTLSTHITEKLKFSHMGINGGNNCNVPLKCEVKGELFLIPPQSRFFCGCVKSLCGKIIDRKFDILVADPPWWNKYIRRLKNANDNLSYSMMYNEDIASIPVKNLLSDNCLIVIWCTNSPNNISAVKNLIFPSWGVEYIATWYWLKVTIDLEPICGFGTGSRKQPYERLILGKVGNVKKVPDSHLVISVPSALHSHKPPLLELLSKYIVKEDPQTLELFARYLLPHTTSIGYEPLKWQHISLYESVT